MMTHMTAWPPFETRPAAADQQKLKNLPAPQRASESAGAWLPSPLAGPAVVGAEISGSAHMEVLLVQKVQVT